MRRTALDAVEAALARADPGPATRALIRREGHWLAIGAETIDLRAVRRIIVLGAGKASFPIAQALEDILGERLSAGIVVAKHGQPGRPSRLRLHLAGHPVPDAQGLAAAREVSALARATGPGDLVFAAITGGSSALLPLPPAGITLADKQELTRLLLACGADIFEINAVRKHLSRIKGGRLARHIHPQARLINLTVSDVVGDAFDYITDPTVPDTSTLADARATLERYRLWQRLPASVRRHLARGGPARESPKNLSPLSVTTHLLVDSAVAATAALAVLTEAGFHAHLLTTALTGDSVQAGRDFAALANSILHRGEPVRSPAAIVAAGETTVSLGGAPPGVGGPNQEFSFAAALALPPQAGALVLGLDTDGSDGPSDLAGAIADATTACRARGLGLDLEDVLRRHDTTTLAEALGDGIRTGATGTNVNDLKLMLLGSGSAA